MFVKNADMTRLVRSNLRGGHGDLQSVDLLNPEDTAGRLGMCTIMEFNPGDSVGPHPHVDNAEIYYALEGEFVFTENGVEYPMHAGDIGITHSGNTHAIENRSEKKAKLLAIVIN
jgi:quercetin dioxygenase-like cupin family protein